MKGILSCVLLALLLVGTFTLTFDVRPAKATAETVYINSDGSVVPSSAPISSPDNVTYTFTANVSYTVYYGVVVGRSNIVIDGKGYTVQGNHAGGNGLTLTGISNVTIKNIHVEGFECGIYLSSSNNNTISGNTATRNNDFGIFLGYQSENNTISGNNATANALGIEIYSVSSKNSVVGNNATANNYGIVLDSSSNITVIGNDAAANNYAGINLYSSSNNTVVENKATGNVEGIWLSDSSNNTVTENDAIANSYGLYLTSSSHGYSSRNIVTANNIANDSVGLQLVSASNNTICHNNFAENFAHTFVDSASFGNAWNDTYPSGDNYWSDYNGTDLYSGPYQNESGSDGICDMRCAIDANNTDYYPLIEPYAGPIPTVDWWPPHLPTASLTYSPSTPEAGETVTFDASGSTSNGKIATYMLDFGDGNAMATPDALITHVYASSGTYNVTLTVTDIYDLTNSTWQMIAIVPVGPAITFVHDVAVTNVTLPSDRAYQGWVINITVTVANLGNATENFTTTLDYDNNTIGAQPIPNLAPNATTTLLFSWNTTNVPYSYVHNYTITATASTVPDETNVTNNQLAGGQIQIRTMGDVNGDGVVNMKDVALAVSAFNTFTDRQRWNPDADLNLDGRVDIRDINAMVLNFNHS